MNVGVEQRLESCLSQAEIIGGAAGAAIGVASSLLIPKEFLDLVII